ncbi:MAG: Asp-tRNA(Asn)/Glu-tRNA(Gln) amidotransferase subunit GatA [Calditrichaeota bacterium]|nr:Asp-tRNA(Asn)/Glu-tRNA(Gln) amidotransferase subunit GatA [Calditrichota bacterium]
MNLRIPPHTHLKEHPEELPAAIEACEKAIGEAKALNAFVCVLSERVRQKAREVIEAVHRGEDKPLCGMILAVKDNISVESVPLTCASGILENFQGLFTATAVARLEDAGALVIGKTNLDEFAMGSSCENSIFGPSRLPMDLERVPGGSSGGSAVAVAAGLVHAALGSDTGGSVRQPAGFCGVVGLKPTYGRISRYGLVAFGSSLDQIAPFARTCEDALILLAVMAGKDEHDSTSAAHPVPDATNGLRPLERKLRIGLPKEYFGEGLQTEVAEAIEEVARELEKSGHHVDEVSLPSSKLGVAVYYILATAEASSNLARYDGARYGFRESSAETLNELYDQSRAGGFGAEVRRRILLGTYVLSAGYYDAYYKRAQRIRRLILNEFEDAFRKADVLLAPASPTTAFKIGEKIEDPLSMYLSDIYTTQANLAGIPSVSVPVGKDSRGLPIGMQVMGPHFSEELILQVGHEVEKLRNGV